MNKSPDYVYDIIFNSAVASLVYNFETGTKEWNDEVGRRLHSVWTEPQLSSMKRGIHIASNDKSHKLLYPEIVEIQFELAHYVIPDPVGKRSKSIKLLSEQFCKGYIDYCRDNDLSFKALSAKELAKVKASNNTRKQTLEYANILFGYINTWRCIGNIF